MNCKKCDQTAIDLSIRSLKDIPNGPKCDQREPSPIITKQSLSSHQVGTKLGLSRDQVEKLLLSAIQATSAAEIRQVMNMTNATKFKRNYIDPLLELRILAMTQPDSPKSPTQKYYLTELGKQLIKI